MPNARLRLAFFSTSWGRSLLRVMGPRGKAWRGLALGRMYYNAALITEETRAGYEVNFADSRSYEYALAVVRSWREDMEKLRGALHSIVNVPVLLLWGHDDKAVACNSGLLLREFFRNSEYVLMRKVGHLPYEEAPEEFNQHVLHFLD
jgi:pimeloyl-ACP methyl ester carboxylesterase